MFKSKEVKRITAVFLVLSLFISVIGISAVEETEINAVDKISSHLLEEMQKSDENDKIPVSVWMTDIDQEAADTIVEEQTGLTRDNLEVIKDHLSDELALKMMGLSDTDITEMRERTEDYSHSQTTEDNVDDENEDIVRQRVNCHFRDIERRN